jgi:hypothetical protein
MVKSRSMRWAEHVEIREQECIQGFVGSQKERDHQEDPELGGRI